MARRTRSDYDAPYPEDVTHASGSAPCPDARRVDLVWRDPVTGEHLSLGLEASPELIASLRQDGFVVAEGGDTATEAAGGTGDGGSTAAA